MSEQNIAPLERRYTEKEVCEMYEIDRSTLRKWREKGIIGWLKLPTGQIRYKRSHLDEFDKKFERRPKVKGEADAA